MKKTSCCNYSYIIPLNSSGYCIFLTWAILILTAILSLKVRGYNYRIYTEKRNKKFIGFVYIAINRILNRERRSQTGRRVISEKKLKGKKSSIVCTDNSSV